MSEDPFKKYRRMLRMGVPEKQVEVAIRLDGLDPKSFDFQLEVEVKPSVDNSFLGGLESKEDGLDKYRKMIKAGLPLGAVEQKMKQDGLDSSSLSINHPIPSTKKAVEEISDTKEHQKANVILENVNKLKHVVDSNSTNVTKEKVAHDIVAGASKLKHTERQITISPENEQKLSILNKLEEENAKSKSTSCLPNETVLSKLKQSDSKLEGKSNHVVVIKKVETTTIKQETNMNNKKETIITKKVVTSSQEKVKPPSSATIDRMKMAAIPSPALEKMKFHALPTEKKSATQDLKNELLSQARRIQEELHNLTQKCKEIPAVQKSLQALDELIQRLRDTMDSKTAKTMFDMLIQMKEMIIGIVETVQGGKVSETVQNKLNNAQIQAQKKFYEYLQT